MEHLAHRLMGWSMTRGRSFNAVRSLSAQRLALRKCDEVLKVRPEGAMCMAWRGWGCGILRSAPQYAGWEERRRPHPKWRGAVVTRDESAWSRALPSTDRDGGGGGAACRGVDPPDDQGGSQADDGGIYHQMGYCRARRFPGLNVLGSTASARR